MAPNQQRLDFVGNTLVGDRILLDYGIKDKDCLWLMLDTFRFWGCLVDVSENGPVQALARSKEMHNWRICTVGLNVEGECADGAAVPLGRQLLIATDHAFAINNCLPKGMVSWTFTADQAHCPVCKQQFQPITCGFVDCVWAYDGRRVSNGVAVEDVHGSWQKADDHQYYASKNTGVT